MTEGIVDSRRAYQRAWYAANKDRVSQYRDERRAERYAFVDEQKRDTPCVDCGGTFHPAAMQYDHVRGEKFRDISNLCAQGHSFEAIQAEIAKCDLRCANCHAIRHYYERNGN